MVSVGGGWKCWLELFGILTDLSYDAVLCTCVCVCACARNLGLWDWYLCHSQLISGYLRDVPTLICHHHWHFWIWDNKRIVVLAFTEFAVGITAPSIKWVEFSLLPDLHDYSVVPEVENMHFLNTQLKFPYKHVLKHIMVISEIWASVRSRLMNWVSITYLCCLFAC